MSGSNVNGGQDPDNRAVGSFQSEMTRRPANAFTTNWSGNHSHGEGFTHHWQNLFNGSPNNIATDDRNWAGIAQADAYGSAGPKDRIFRYRPDEGGNHNHFIEGGDPETRPKNRSVYYIIKAR